MGCAAGVEAAALEVVQGLRGRLRRVAGLVAGRRRPRVLSLEGLDPLCLGMQRHAMLHVLLPFTDCPDAEAQLGQDAAAALRRLLRGPGWQAAAGTCFHRTLMDYVVCSMMPASSSPDDPPPHVL